MTLKTEHKPLRAALYARYSSDLQRDASIEDQLRVNHAVAARDGCEVVKVYSDRAISGASLVRSGVQELQREARLGLFDVVIAESLDRISRDQEHIAGFYKQMTFQGIFIVTAAEGLVNELHIGLKGTISAIFLKDLARKTHRGLEGRVRGGKSAGGRAYGYRAVVQFASDGTPFRGDLVVDEVEAKVIHRVFRDYAPACRRAPLRRASTRKAFLVHAVDLGAPPPSMATPSAASASSTTSSTSAGACGTGSAS